MLRLLSRVSLFVLLCTITDFTARAQVHLTATGNAYELPKKGLTKLVSLNNGGAFLCQFDDKEKVEIRVYDGNHKQSSFKSIDLGFGNLKSSKFEQLFQSGDKVCMLIQVYLDHWPRLYRIMFDSRTGDMLTKEELVHLGKSTTFMEKPAAEGFIAIDLKTVYEPSTGTYAIALLGEGQSQTNQKLLICLFNKEHKLLKREFIHSPDSAVYNVLRFQGFCITGPESVTVLVIGRIERKRKEPVTDLFFFQMSATGSSSLVKIPAGHDGYFLSESSLFSNINSGRVFTVFFQPSKQFASKEMLVAMDLRTGEMVIEKNISNETAFRKAVAVFGKEARVRSSIQSILVNDDKSFTVIYQEVIDVSGQYKKYTWLGGISTVEYDATGQELKAHYLPILQFLEDYLASSYGSSFDNLGYTFLNEYRFFAFSVIGGDHNRYVLINDLLDNDWEKVQKGKLSKMKDLDKTAGYMFDLNANEIMLERQPLFSSGQQVIQSSSVSYNMEKDFYVALRMNTAEKKDMVEIIWFEIEPAKN